MLTLQLTFNNLLNVLIERSSNKIVYDFKIRELIHAIVVFFLSKNINTKTKYQLVDIEATRFRYRIEITNVIFYVSVQSKIQYDSKHVSLLLRLEKKIYFQLYYNYTLSKKSNYKLSKQRYNLFSIKRRVDRLVYKLKLLFR